MLKSRLLNILALVISFAVHPSFSLEYTREVEWLRSKKDGYFSEKITWKSFGHQDSSKTKNRSYKAMFVPNDVKKDETIIFVPNSALISGEGGPCHTVDIIIEEFEKGIDSDYYPIIDHFFGDINKKIRIPVAWSDSGKALLKTLIGQSLQPQDFDQQLIQVYCEDTPGDINNVSQLEQDAFLFMSSRSRDGVMIPFYDMISHRNGKMRNVEVEVTENGVKFYAFRDIEAGEHLNLSYNECKNVCNGLEYTYLTSNIFGDHGFVEQYPRRFALSEDSKLVAQVDIDETSGDKVLTWPLMEKIDMDQLNLIDAQWKRLRALYDVIYEGTDKLESSYERDVIREYYEALKEVMELAIAYRDDGTQNQKESSAAKKFDSLSQPKGVGVDGLNIEVCWDNPSDRDWDTDDSAQSQYQSIFFTYNKEQDNTCLQLSGWLQTCTNFRPHYHEAFVHVPAQYVEDVRRVIFLGGGDNMILHEILKYPNLNLVVGMELDQQVIRSSFKNLGTLPYFDDHRVQWWFGDATKSLFALPESYFGSFDLVLVDLQTFVADALKVTDKLTIMETAILLMKQDGGVIAKNEDFNVRTNVGFAKYTVDLEYHDLPHICQQSITMGSNSIDFLKAKPKSHEIETKAIKVAGNGYADPYHAWYSYRQTVHDTCKNNDVDFNATSKATDQRGVLVILEAESIAVSVESPTKLQDMITNAVKEAGFKGFAISSSGDDKIFFLVMKEGYVAARLFTDDNYIAFDVMLWEKLDLVDDLNGYLLRAVGCDLEKSSSSFRFVTGGMYGLEASQTDLLSQIASDTDKLLCQDSGSYYEYADIANENVSVDIFHQLVESLLLPQHRYKSSPSVVVTFCGSKTDVCPLINAAKTLDMTKTPIEAIPIYSCVSSDDMSSCEKDTEQTLKKIVREHKRLDVLALDTALPFAMGQIIESIFSNRITFHKLMEESHLVLTPIVQSQRWRERLTDRFRTDMVLFNPAHRADLRFYQLKKGKKGSWTVFSAGDYAFFNHLSSALSIIKARSGIDSEVDEVANGIVNYVPDFSPSQVFTDSDYDKNRSKTQWFSQKPLGHQTIFQMNVQPPKTRLGEGELVLAEHQPGPWDVVYGGAVVKKYLGDEMYSVLYDGESEPEDINRSQIRKFSESDTDTTAAFQVGDLIFYKNRRGLYQNGVITREEDDGKYSIYLLNTSGTKLYNIPRSSLMFQFETADFYQDVPALSTSALLTAFKTALNTKFDINISPIKTFPVGSGVLMTAFGKDGHAILKWDGLKRVDINMFTFREDKSLRIAFQDDFCGQIDYLVSISRDEQPRGHGSIVNFESEIKTPPHWV